MNERKLFEVSQNIVDLCCREKGLEAFDGFLPINLPLAELADNLPVFYDATPDVFERVINSRFFFSEDRCFVRIKKEDSRRLVKTLKGFYTNCYSYVSYYVGNEQATSCIFQNKSDSIEPKIIYPKECVGNKSIERKLKMVFVYALALQFSMENSFCVYIKPQKKGIGFRFPITRLESCKELFKLRDVPPGEERRKALINFVSEHLRRKPSSDEETLVRKHLRGAERFNWQGFYCEIQSPVGTGKKRGDLAQ